MPRLTLSPPLPPPHIALLTPLTRLLSAPYFIPNHFYTAPHIRDNYNRLRVLKCGACYVPIEPDLPAERRAFIVHDSDAKLAIDANTLHTHLQAAKLHSEEQLDILSPDDLAYLLYTSGTTGKPKGCLCTHGGLSEAILALSSFAYAAGHDNARYLALASIAFDVHISEIFVALAIGSTLISAARNELLDDLPHWLRLLNITHVGIVPSLIEATMGAVDSNSEGRLALRYIASGGEKINDSILERWGDHRQVKLANFYGPSEVTIGCAARFMTKNTRKESIGRSFSNCSAYVVDERMQVVMLGAVGELIVAGPLVGKGYHGRPDLTQKAFIQWEGENAYRTGDLVRMMPDFSLEILGRTDSQIKLRGVRIEPEGISNVLREAASSPFNSPPKLDVVTALTRHPMINADQIVSFVSWETSVSLSRRRNERPKILTDTPPGLMKTLRHACMEKLASYMRPAHIIPVNFIPLNANGKMDTNTLLSVFHGTNLKTLGNGYVSDDGKRASHIVERNREVYTALTKLISRQLGHSEPLNPSMSLFEIGFDSLKFVRLATDIRLQFDLKPTIQPGEIMKEAHIEALAQLMNSRLGKVSPTDLQPRVDSPLDHFHFQERWYDEIQKSMDISRIQSILPTFPIQDGVLYRAATSLSQYVQHTLLLLREGISVEVLKAAWRTMIKRHEILRTIFFFSKSVLQLILHDAAVELPWKEQQIDLVADEELARWYFEHEAPAITAAINREINEVPPLRLNLYRAQGNNVLAVSIGHAIFDANSLAKLFEDVEKEYLHPGSVEPSFPLVRALEEVYAFDINAARAYFVDAFKGFDWSKVAGTMASSGREKQVTLHFKTKLSKIKTISSDAKVTLQALFINAYAKCLADYLYSFDDIVIGVIRSGRASSSTEFNNAQCPLLSVLPMRVKHPQGEHTLESIQRNIADTMQFEHVSLNKIQAWVCPGKSLFDTLFSTREADKSASTLWDVVDSKQPGADYFLAVEITTNIESDEVVIHATFIEDDISSDTVSLILENIEPNVFASTGWSTTSFETISSPIHQTLDVSVSALKSLPPQATTLQKHKTTDPDNPQYLRVLTSITVLLSNYLDIDAQTISPEATLTSLGLDSITSMGFSRLLRREGMEISTVEVMESSTICDLADLAAYSQTFARTEHHGLEAEGDRLLTDIRRTLLKTFDDRACKLAASDLIVLYPTTSLQAGMLSQTISSKGSLYVHPFSFILPADVDAHCLKEAWEQAIKSFEMLRTSFHFLEEPASWVQVVHSELDFKWSEAYPSYGGGLKGHLEEFVASIKLPTIESFARPPIYLRFFPQQMKSTEYPRLVVVMHHALYDAISLPKMLWAIQEFYYQSKPSVDFANLSSLMAYFAHQERYGTQYWIRYLHGFNHSRVSQIASPLSRLQLANKNMSIQREELQRVSKQCGVTLQCFGQAAWAILLAELTISKDIVFGLVVSGRNAAAPRSEDIMGPMLNTIPCRVRLTDGSSYQDILSGIHHDNISALQWQHASLRAVQRALGVSGLFDTTFFFQLLSDDTGNESSSRVKLWQFEQIESRDELLQYPISIELHQSKERMNVMAACGESVMTAGSLKAMVSRFCEIFQALVEDPGRHWHAARPEDLASASQSLGPLSISKGTDHDLDTYTETTLSDSQLAVIRQVFVSAMHIPAHVVTFQTPLVSLGVDSISAIQLVAMFRRLGVPLHAADILRSTVVSDLGSLFNRDLDKEKVRQEPEVKDTKKIDEIVQILRLHYLEEPQEILPVSSGMKWFIAVWQRTNGARCQHAFAFDLSVAGLKLEASKVRTAWESLADRHAILRSTFISTKDGDEPSLVMFKNLTDSNWAEDHLSDAYQPKHALQLYMENLVSNPLAASQPPSRAIFLQNNNGSSFLIIQLHHFQYDAWSLPLLLEDLTSILNDRLPTNDNRLDRALSFMKNSQSKREQQELYWRHHFPPNFNGDNFPQLNTQPNQSPSRLLFTKIFQDLALLREKSREVSITLPALVMASWARVHAAYTQCTDVAFGLWHACRSQDIDAIDRLAIPCVNILPIFIKHTDDSLQQVAQQIMSNLKKRTPVIEQSDWEAVHSWVATGQRPICNVFINIYESTHDRRGDLPVLEATLKPVDMPYFVPQLPDLDLDRLGPCSKLRVAEFIQDDMMIDFVLSDAENTVHMTIECNGEMMDTKDAENIMSRCGSEMMSVLNGIHRT